MIPSPDQMKYVPFLSFSALALPVFFPGLGPFYAFDWDILVIED